MQTWGKKQLDMKLKNFRGNFTFATAEQIENRRADRIDDLFSLLYVAFRFVKNQLPWEKAVEKAVDKQIEMTQNTFIQLRYQKRREFET